MQHQLIGHDAVKPPVTFREMRNLVLIDQEPYFMDFVRQLVELPLAKHNSANMNCTERLLIGLNGR